MLETEINAHATEEVLERDWGALLHALSRSQY